MPDYDFIIDNIRFSYSAISTYETCNYAYKLAYIDVVPRENNFYAQYGNLIHECFEKYFSGKIDSYEISQYYIDNYDFSVSIPAPMYGMGDKYREQGQLFFDNFSFNKEDYTILLIEDKVDFDVEGIMAVAKPDLVLRENATGKSILYDYKTATPYRKDSRTGKEIADNKKLEGYYNQMHVYTYALNQVKNISIDEIALWFTRLNKIVTIPKVPEKEEKAIFWFGETIKKIKADERFMYDNSNSYFCENLCGVRAFCEYR
jgi:hypothetical protein